MDLLVDGYVFPFEFLIHWGKVETVCFRIVNDVKNGKKPRDIKSRLSRETLIEV